MAKKLMQFRYKENDTSSSNITLEDLTGSNIFENYNSISQLGIQAGPGTKFKLGSTANDYPIEIGVSGIYELDLQDYGYINYIKFEKVEMPYAEINKSGEAIILPLLIDIIYEGGVQS